MLGYRSNDAVLTICQNNTQKSIEIIAINEAATTLTGFASNDIVGRALVDVIPSRIAGLMSEYVEFDADSNDVGHVLSKVQSFSLLTKDAKEHAYRLRVIRANATPERMEFRLVLQDDHAVMKENAARKALEENFRGHEVIDPALGMPNRQSLAKDIELASMHNNKTGLRSCFSVFQLDYANALTHQYGAEIVAKCVKHLAVLSRNSLRPYDVIGSVGDHRVGILLLDTTPDSARMVANRLRWQIAANPFILPDSSTLVLSASAVFSRIGGRPEDMTILAQCDAALDALPEDSANSLQEV